MSLDRSKMQTVTAGGESNTQGGSEADTNLTASPVTPSAATTPKQVGPFFSPKTPPVPVTGEIAKKIMHVGKKL